MRVFEVTWPWGVAVVLASDADEARSLAAEAPEHTDGAGWAETGHTAGEVRVEELSLDGDARWLTGHYG